LLSSPRITGNFLSLDLASVLLECTGNILPSSARIAIGCDCFIRSVSYIYHSESSCCSCRRVLGPRPAKSVALQRTINLSLSIRKGSSVPRPGGSALISFPRHWLVSTECCLSCMSCPCTILMTLPCSTDIPFAHSSHPRPLVSFSSYKYFSNMHFYMSLTFLALAASTFPFALSAPIR